MKKNLQYLLLLLIVLLAFFLRFYKVTEIPPSLNWDEVSIGYNAYSILKTGKDEWGNSFPVHFKAYGEFKLPAQVYLSIPGIYLFGLNEMGVRITPVIYGTLTVLVIFFLGRALFLSNIAGLTSAFLLAISPWHIQLTRASFESSLAALFVALGMWFLVKGFNNQKWFLISMVPFALSVFTYNTARIFTPLFLITTLLLYRKHLVKYKKFVALSMIMFTILLLPLTPYLLSGERSSRYKLVSITDDPGLVLRINENRGKSNLPNPLPKLIHNKATYVALTFTENYLAHFTPQFLFISGAPHKQHHVQNMGELYYFQAPFLLIGLIALFKKKHRFKGILLSWVLLTYIPVAVTGDSIPHALRPLIAVSFYQLVSGYGFYLVFNFLTKKGMRAKFIFGCFLLIVIVFEMSRYLYNYYEIYPKNYSRDWQYGYKQVVDYIGKHKDEYDEIVFTRHYGEPHMFTLFYLNYDPAKYQNNPNLERFETHDWVRVLKFDMFYFASNGEQKKVSFYFPDLGDNGTQFADIIKQNPGKKLLFIARSGDFPKEIPRLLSVDFLNGEDAFDIVEVK